MPIYKQAPIAGESRQRANQVVIDNPLIGTPRISFIEEEVIALSDGRLLRNPVPGVGCEFEAGATFPLLNPVDDSVTGEATHDHAQAVIYSIYRHLRALADGA